MRQTDRINKEFALKEVQLLHNKAIALANLLTDEEYELMITKHPDIFAIVSHPEKGDLYLSDKSNLLIIIDIINEHLKHQHLSQDEFKVMTLDEIKEYMQSVISDITSFSPDELYDTIIKLEDIVANSHYDNVIKMRTYMQEIELVEEALFRDAYVYDGWYYYLPMIMTMYL